MPENITPIYPLLPMKEKVFLLDETESFDVGVGGLRGNASQVQLGAGESSAQKARLFPVVRGEGQKSDVHPARNPKG